MLNKKIIALNTLYFIGLLLFLKYNIVLNARTEEVHETDVLLKASTDSIPNSSSFVSLATLYFSSNIISLNVHTNYFCTWLFEVIIDNTQQEKYLHIMRDI